MHANDSQPIVDQGRLCHKQKKDRRFPHRMHSGKRISGEELLWKIRKYKEEEHKRSIFKYRVSFGNYSFQFSLSMKDNLRRLLGKAEESDPSIQNDSVLEKKILKNPLYEERYIHIDSLPVPKIRFDKEKVKRMENMSEDELEDLFPIVYDGKEILDGRHRFMALKLSGKKSVLAWMPVYEDDDGKYGAPLEEVKEQIGSVISAKKLIRIVMERQFKEGVSSSQGEKSTIPKRIGIHPYYQLKNMLLSDLPHPSNIGINEEVVEKYASMDFVDIPPIVYNGKAIVDGNHRYLGVKMMGRKHILAFVPTEISDDFDTKL